MRNRDQQDSEQILDFLTYGAGIVFLLVLFLRATVTLEPTTPGEQPTPAVTVPLVVIAWLVASATFALRAYSIERNRSSKSLRPENSDEEQEGDS